MTKILREQHIIDAYNFLGFSPRDSQMKIVDNIVHSFLDKKKRNVILSAPTGSGKSIIAAVVARVLDTITNGNGQSAIFMSSTNALVNQYADTFNHHNESEFFRIKGASNYPCNYFISKGNTTATGEECAKNDLDVMEQTHFCNKCSYDKAKGLAKTTNNLITNYALFMTSATTNRTHCSRNLQVFDEAHLINDVYCEFVAVTIDVTNLDAIIKILNNLASKFSSHVDAIQGIRAEIQNQMVTDSNYIKFFDRARSIFTETAKEAARLADLHTDVREKARYLKISKRVANIAHKIKEFLKNDYEHVFDNSTVGIVSVKPIFVSEMMEALLGKYNLFMSATLSVDFAATTMNLDPDETDYIDVGVVFPPENLPLFFVGTTALNYHQMQMPETFVNLGKLCANIIASHGNDKGIILTPSFAVTKKIVDNLGRFKSIYSKNSDVKIFEHQSGKQASEIVTEFKEYEGAAVLLSPSIFEGIDFADDHSRYQIILKTPFASLGDKRMSKIAKDYPEIYRSIGLLKIIQGIGRSVRSSTDTAATYFTDKSSETLYNSKLNIWKNRFSVQYSSSTR
jgi:Rad3-related DNA helicase